MKTSFTKEYILQNRGCYSKKDALSHLKDQPEFTIQQILDFDISIKDKSWFIRNKCELTTSEFRELAIGCALCVLSIYESKYPDNKAPREAIQSAKDYLAGTIGIDELRTKRAAAYAAYTAAYAAADAAYAAYAAADAAYDAAAYAAADAAAAAAYTAAYAAYAAAYAAADAAYAAAYAAADAAYDAAAYAAVDAAYAAYDAAAYAAGKTNYKELLLTFFKEFMTVKEVV